MRPVLLGMNNPSALHPGEALSPLPKNSTGRRLWQMSGMTLAAFQAAFERRNLLGRRRWSEDAAREAGERAKADLGGRLVLVLGRQTWEALGLPASAAWFSCWRVGRGVFFLVPHPSGRCRVYNDRSQRRELRNLMELVAR